VVLPVIRPWRERIKLRIRSKFVAAAKLLDFKVLDPACGAVIFSMLYQELAARGTIANQDS
jgi:hypothetical protein